MRKNEDIRMYTADELRAKAAKIKIDWSKVDSMTEEELESAIASDPDEAGMVVDWSRATVVMPKPKAVLNMRIDNDVLEYFKHQGKGYQTLINAVLRSYVERKGRRSRLP
jgi:uncharacterized protein (DUF4415 family)